MKNKLTDLNDALFAQLERLSEEGMEGEALETEIRRAETIVQVADTIVENARLQLEGAKLVATFGGDIKQRLPTSLGITAGAPPADGPGK